MLFLGTLILQGLREITNLHNCNVTKIITGDLLDPCISNRLRIFTCKVNINLFLNAFG